jgi:hypothetical protein
MDGGQALGGDPGVDVGGGEVAVTEELLDVADIGPAFEHQRGAGMAKKVTAPRLADL